MEEVQTEKPRHPQGGGRLHYLDNLRIFALCLGVFVHGNGFLSAADQLPGIKIISANFRMATFYFVAGYFAVMVVGKRGSLEFYKRRILALGVPLLTGAIVLNAVNIPLKESYRSYFLLREGTDMVTPSVPPLLHLWFLVCLLAFVALTPLVIMLVKSKLVSEAVSTLALPHRAAASCFALTTSVVVYCIGVRFISAELNLHFLVRSTLYFLPFYALGCLLFAYKEASSIFYRIDIPSIAMAIGLTIMGYLLPQDSGLQKIGFFGGRTAFQCCITFGLLWFFRAHVNVSNSITSMLSRSVYTIYILHYLLLTIVSALWIRILPSNVIQNIVTSLIVCGLGLLIHIQLVERFALFGFLLNGKLPEKQRAKREGVAAMLP